jgi:hypothetical protein
MENQAQRHSVHPRNDAPIDVGGGAESQELATVAIGSSIFER